MKARPVSADVRELAWTSVIGIALPNESTELILWVKDEVPDIVFLDEVYCTRILMNLLRYHQSTTNLILVILSNSQVRGISLSPFHLKGISSYYPSKTPVSESARNSQMRFSSLLCRRIRH